MQPRSPPAWSRTTELETLREGVGNENLPAAVAWLASSIELAQLLDDAGRGSARIAELVKALKSYSYEGQAPMQEVDLHDGIEDTLTILKHKLKGSITVVRDYDRTLPKLLVYGSELNQVWTNLIDNAADALNGSGTITIRTRREGDHAVVEIDDDGPGIPPEIQPRVFDPFFTTKDQGKGSGLGLDIAYRSVVNRHRGNIRLALRTRRHTLRSRAADLGGHSQVLSGDAASAICTFLQRRAIPR